MRFRDFDRRARQIFEEIPPDFREGVDGIAVRPEAVPHPTLPEIYTLGECLTEHYPSEFGGPGEVLSTVVLYHGSFQRLAELDPDWDWEHELWETVTHEVRHHLESLAADDALEVQDYAEDQNLARREGVAFDAFFYRQGVRLEAGVWEVDGDHFIESPVAAGGGDRVRIDADGVRGWLPLPDPLAGVHFVTLSDEDLDGERVLVLVRRRGAWGAFRELLTGSVPEVLCSQGQLTLS